MVSPPTLFAAGEKLGFKELINITDMDFAFPNPVFGSRTVLKSRPGYQPIHARYARGIQRAKNDRGFTYKSMVLPLKIQDTTVLQKAYDLYIGRCQRRRPTSIWWVCRTLWRISRRRPPLKARSPNSLSIIAFDNLDKSGPLKELYPGT